MHEHFFQCPYCWESISMLVDTSVATTQYVEDCEVCCRPIEIQYSCDAGALLSFTAENMEHN